MQRCPTCDTELPDELGACPGCAEEPHHCPRCQSVHRDPEACPVCGAIGRPVPCALHPERSATGRCVICGQPLCEACGPEPRGAYLCEAHRRVPMIQGWAQVYSTTGEVEAQLVRDNLHAEGIDAQVFSQRDNIFAVEVGELSIVRILVPVWQYAHAQAVIRDHMDAGGEVAFACPACGEAYEAGTRECATCGAVLV